jgi:hypothetical protein
MILIPSFTGFTTLVGSYLHKPVDLDTSVFGFAPSLDGRVDGTMPSISTCELRCNGTISENET